MLYTGRGDDGTTTLYGGRKRIGKDSYVIEALGSVDEVNSFIGWCKATARAEEIKQALEAAQQVLFVLQAEIAGAEKAVQAKDVQRMEKVIKKFSAELPEIKRFIIAGGTERAAMFDVARTIARRAERCINNGLHKKELKIGEQALAYLNRLSSLLYVLARVTNARARKKEKPPEY